MEQEGESLGGEALPLTQGLDNEGVSRGNQFVVVGEPRRQAQEGLVRPRISIHGLKLELVPCIRSRGFLTDASEIHALWYIRVSDIIPVLKLKGFSGVFEYS